MRQIRDLVGIRHDVCVCVRAPTAPTASHSPCCSSFLLSGNETKTAGSVGDDRACLRFTEPHTDPHIKQEEDRG